MHITHFWRDFSGIGYSLVYGNNGRRIDNVVADNFFAALGTELWDRHSRTTKKALISGIFEFAAVVLRPPLHSSILQ